MNMSRKIAFIFLLAVTLTISHPVYSQSPSQLRTTIIQQRQELRKEMKAKREAMKEQFKADREEFKKKLSEIKNERKKAVVERINTKLININKNRTSHFNKVLDRLKKHLDKINSQTQTLQSSDINTTDLDEAITAAQNAIDNARTAVATQEANEYIITITSEENLRGDVGKTMKQLQQDLQTVRESVLKAKKAVIEAIIALAKLKGSQPTNTISPSP